MDTMRGKPNANKEIEFVNNFGDGNEWIWEPGEVKRATRVAHIRLHL